jgi:hypothetical protein
LAKLNLNDITSTYRSATALNANFDAIETAVENTLSRDGTSPNAMAAVLDMGSNRIINLTDPTAAQDGATKAYVDSIASTISDINDITHVDGVFIVSDGTKWVGESDATARASMGVSIGSDVQAYDAGLTDIAGLATTDGNIIVGSGSNWVAESGATARTSLGLGIGSDVQAYDAGLTSIAGLTTAADKMIYTTGSDTYAVTDLSSFARTLLDDTTATAARVTLGVDDNVRTLRSYGCSGDGTTDDTTNFNTAVADAQANGYKLRGEGRTYRVTSLLSYSLSSGDELDMDDMEIYVDKTTGLADSYGLTLSAGSLGTSANLNANCNRGASAIDMTGATKPTAGEFYMLLDDGAADFATSKDTEQGALIQIAPEYNGTDNVVTLANDVPCSFTTANTARIRRHPGQDVKVRIGQDQGNFSLRGPGGTYDISAMRCLLLHNPQIAVRKISQFDKRGFVDIGGVAPDVVIDRVEDCDVTGFGYAVVTVATQGGRLWVKSTANVGIVYSATGESVSIDGESFPCRDVDFPLTVGMGSTRSALDTHRGAFYTRFGGFYGSFSASDSGSDDGIVLSGSCPIIYGPIKIFGTGHRHLVNYAPSGNQDDSAAEETLTFTSIEGDTDQEGLIVSVNGTATFTGKKINVTGQSLYSVNGTGGLQVQPDNQAGDIHVHIDSAIIRASSGRGVYSIAQSGATGDAYITIGNADIISTGAAALEIAGDAAGGAGEITILSGRAERTDAGGARLAASYGNINLNAGVNTTGGSTAKSEANGGVVREFFVPSITSAATGDVLYYNGSSWVNDTQIGGVNIEKNGTDNVAIARAAINASSGNNNLSIGNAAGGTSYTATAQDNVCLGVTAGQDITDGVRNICVGVSAGLNITTGGNNITLGYSAAPALTTGSNNFALGSSSLTSVVTGSGNICIGPSALTGYTGSNVVAIGNTAVRYPTGAHNTGIGLSALAGNAANNDSAQNTAIGSQALAVIGDGTNGGDSNVAIGYNSGVSTTSGDQNTFLGTLAGDANTTGDRNICIGYNADVSAGTAADELNIGNFLKSTDITGKVATLGSGGVDYIPTSQESTGATTTANGTLAVEINGTTYYLLTASTA